MLFLRRCGKREAGCGESGGVVYWWRGYDPIVRPPVGGWSYHRFLSDYRELHPMYDRISRDQAARRYAQHEAIHVRYKELFGQARRKGFHIPCRKSTSKGNYVIIVNVIVLRNRQAEVTWHTFCCYLTPDKLIRSLLDGKAGTSHI